MGGRPPRCGPLLLALLVAGCAGSARWKRTPTPEPAAGLDAAEVLAILYEGALDDGYTVRVEERFVSRIEDGVWTEISPEAAVADASGAEVRIAMVARRTCSDWEREEGERLSAVHHTAERPSWFLLRGGRVVAYDHWRFGPRCSLTNHFRPARTGDRDAERTFLRFVAQRFPAPPPEPEVRFARGHAFLEAGRPEDARRALESGDRAMDAWRAAHEHHDLAPEAQAALDAREKSLRRARAELSVALARALRERDGEPEDPTQRFFEGLAP
jgi:hypothetical protein